MTTWDMPLGPRTGSNPAGSAENAALRTPPRLGSAKAGEKAPPTIWRPDSVRAPRAIPPARTSRRLRHGAVMALWEAGELIELSRIRPPVAHSREAAPRRRRIRRVKSFEYSSLEFAVSMNGLRKQ